MATPESWSTVLETEVEEVLLVKGTFLEVSDGRTLQERGLAQKSGFRQIRKAATYPLGEESVEIYEPGLHGFCSEAEVQDPNSKPEPDSSRDVSARRRQEAGDKGKQYTTVMLRNLPNKYTRSMLIELLEDWGFRGHFDFLYLPIDFNRKTNLGYAFVNLVSQESAAKFWSTFERFTSWSTASCKVCRLSWSGPKQGYRAHVERYKNSPVMHKSVPEEFKPVIFVDGVPCRFPRPTIRIQHPKHAGKH